jgi:hypothetical protein
VHARYNRSGTLCCPSGQSRETIRTNGAFCSAFLIDDATKSYFVRDAFLRFSIAYQNYDFLIGLAAKRKWFAFALRMKYSVTCLRIFIRYGN